MGMSITIWLDDEESDALIKKFKGEKKVLVKIREYIKYLIREDLGL